MKSDDVYVEHILEAIEKIEEYTEGLTEEDFNENSLVQDGVIRQIEVIGEAAKQLSEEKKKQYDAIEWADIAGMRDNLIHKYFGVDLEQVWETVQKDVPRLKEVLMD